MGLLIGQLFVFVLLLLPPLVLLDLFLGSLFFEISLVYLVLDLLLGFCQVLGALGERTRWRCSTVLVVFLRVLEILSCDLGERSIVIPL